VVGVWVDGGGLGLTQSMHGWNSYLNSSQSKRTRPKSKFFLILSNTLEKYINPIRHKLGCELQTSYLLVRDQLKFKEIRGSNIIVDQIVSLCGEPKLARLVITDILLQKSVTRPGPCPPFQVGIDHDI
jgi:hypothetical protein